MSGPARKGGTWSTPVLVGALVAIAALATAGVLYVSGDKELEKIGLLFAIFGTIIPGLIGSLRADQAATQTNGTLDARIQDAVGEAIKARRSSDTVVIHESPVADPVTIEPLPPPGATE